MFLPQQVLQDATLEWNYSRYRVTSIVVSPFGSGAHYKAVANLTRSADRDTLLHPNFCMYYIHVVAAGIAVLMALYVPSLLMALLISMVLLWPASYVLGFQICRLEPGSSTWWLMCIKSAIVNICPTTPVLLCIIKKDTWGRAHHQIAGGIGYFILWANVFWTLFFPLLATYNHNLTCTFNTMTGGSLCIALLVHLFGHYRNNVDLCHVEGKVFYGCGTSLSWLICYTVWNALFVLTLAPGLTLQDILFWAMMFAFYYYTGKSHPIEDYFSMARPIQLGMYIGLSDWADLIPFFCVPGVGLDVNRHAFFLFISTFNFIYSFYVLIVSIMYVIRPGTYRDLSMYKLSDASDDSDSGTSDLLTIE